MKLILASGSPRRKELLSRAGFLLDIHVSDCKEESACTNPGLLVEDLSHEKAVAVWKELEDQIADTVVLGADTVVSIFGNVLGKPSDEEDAYRKLRFLSGKTHEVYTGVTLVKRVNEQMQCHTFHECTKVHIAQLSEEEIRAYIATKDPMDKAGAYGIQGIFGKFVSGIEGDYNNVVGLPVARVYAELKKLGWLED